VSIKQIKYASIYIFQQTLVINSIGIVPRQNTVTFSTQFYSARNLVGEFNCWVLT